MKNLSKKTTEEMESSYQYLFEKIMKDKRKDLSIFVLQFREQLLKEEKLRSYSDLVALDILYFHSVNNNEEPWKGRDAANEAFQVLETRETTFDKEEAMSAYLQLAEVFNYLEDVDRERKSYENASYLAFSIRNQEKAVFAKENEIRLVWRYPENERKILFPTKESLMLQFGLEEGKRLFEFEKEAPRITHDPIESNPLFTKIIDSVNIALKEHFDNNKDDFNLDNYNTKKRQLLLEYGIDWKAPY